MTTTHQMVLESPPVIEPAVANSFAAYETIEVWSAGTQLFREGSSPAGVYFLHSGDVDLSISSRAGDSRSVHVVGTGQILGLTSVLSGRAHDFSAMTRTGCTTGFIERERFLRLLDEHPGIWLSVLRMISTNINACWDCMRQLSMGR